MSDQLQSALLRGLLGSIATGALIALTTYQTTGSWKAGLIGGGIALCSYLLTRGLGEGLYDTQQAKTTPG